MAAWRAFRILHGAAPAGDVPPAAALAATPGAVRHRGVVLGTVLGAAPAAPVPSLQGIVGGGSQQVSQRTAMGAAPAPGWMSRTFPVQSQFGAVIGVPLPPEPPLQRPRVSIDR